MDHDVLIIGSGQAGVPLARRLCGAGRRVLLVERSFLGGTCVNYGCTPTKTMVASARAAHVARTAGRLGVHCGEITVDFPAIIARKDQIVARWRAGVEKGLAGAGDKLTVVHGHARLTGAQQIEVSGQRYNAPVIILNTGARPTVPKLDGLDSVPWLDNARIMALRELPAHLIVLGGGYIACEFGQMFRRFGSQVTLLQRAAHLIDREDEDVSAALEAVFASEGMDVRCGVRASRVAKDGHEVIVHLEGGGEVRGSHLLVATGRTPNADDLGCEAAGVARDAHGAVQVDDRYETSVPGIYAVGDVTGGPQFTHTSWDDHRVLFEHLMGRPARKRSDRVVPSGMFTDPQVARVGLSEREARAQGVVYEVATMPFGNIARAIELDETAGTMKVLIDPATERILGAAIVGIEAGELIHLFVDLMAAGASARAIVEAEHIHPTLAEGVQSLVMLLARYKL